MALRLYTASVSPRANLKKVIDSRDDVRCASGSIAVRREEVWINHAGEVIWYNLALIHHLTLSEDNGRILGYDNRHGMHERHWMGGAEAVTFTKYEDTVERFQSELAELRRQI